MGKCARRMKKVVRVLFDAIPFGIALRNTICNKFKIVKMHETHTGKKHALLYQADCVPSETTIKRRVADVYGTRVNQIVIDDVRPYVRRKDEPIERPTRQSVIKNARFSAFAPRGNGDIIYQLGHADALHEVGLDNANDFSRRALL